MAMAVVAMPMSVAPCFHCGSRTRQRHSWGPLRRRSSQQQLRHRKGDVVDSNNRPTMDPAFSFVACAAAAAAFLGSDAAAAAATGGDALLVADLGPEVARVLLNVLGPVFASFNLLFIVRIVMSWYPKIPVNKLPFVIAYAPTEPVLAPTRRIIRPIGGVDMAPVAWVAFMSFANEVLLGQQGLLVLLSEQRL